MHKIKSHRARFILFLLVSLTTLILLAGHKPFQVSGASPSTTATYSEGSLHLSIPYLAPRAGAGELTLEVLDPGDRVLGETNVGLKLTEGKGQWQETIRLKNPLPLDELVWHRIRYRFVYDGQNNADIEGVESISEILLRPVVHVLAQQSYLAGSKAAVRVIVTDSQNQPISGDSSVRIEFQGNEAKAADVFSGPLNERGTTEAQFQFPAGRTGDFQLHYTVETPIGSTELTQAVRLEDKVSILLSTEKPIYQPGQTIHVRALALDRSNHEASVDHKLTFEFEDSRGNKVFKKITATDEFGIASAEFGLADEVNLGTYHLRALMGDAEAPTNSAEMALNVERYVLPKFKVAVDFSEQGQKRHGYRPGEHVRGTVRVNYFFGKPVSNGEVSIKASAMDVTLNEVVATQGSTDADGSYKFDLHLPDYFAGRPLSQGAARVLIEATVKDSAGHSETRGEPLTVSESPLLITAVPEGGTLVPGLDNQVFILTTYPDGTPAKTHVKISGDGITTPQLSTDAGGVAMAQVRPKEGTATLKVDASDPDGNTAVSSPDLTTRDGDDQILLHTERAVYRAGQTIHLKVFSTRSRGAAYIDIVKDGQTVLTRDLDLQNGQAELFLAATPDMAGTVDISAYQFGKDARPQGDHRLIFVQPADELKIETTADAPVYKPGAEAQIRFHVTNTHGEGVRAALGLQVVDEAVFALAEKQPGFAKVFFYLEQEAMKPRYEIHSIGLPEVVESTESSETEQHDRAARALFSATEMVTTNQFESEAGREVPVTKQAEYAGRYQTRLVDQMEKIAKTLTESYQERSGRSDFPSSFAKMESSQRHEFQDAWGTPVQLQPAYGCRSWDVSYYPVRSAGPDRKFNTSDDLSVWLEVRTGKIVDLNDAGDINVRVEHDRGPDNGLSTITGTVVDSSGAVVPGARVEVLAVKSKAVRRTRANANGQFEFPGLAAGEYKVYFVMPGFRRALKTVTLQGRDRAVFSATLLIGSSTETVQAIAALPALEKDKRMDFLGGIATGRGQMMEMKESLGDEARVAAPPPMAAPLPRNEAAKAGTAGGQAEPTARVRSYFPEAVYINPEIIMDKDGRASITVPIADSITSWRMAMIASTQHGALGTSTSSLKVFQDFFVDLDLPVTLTQGDRISIPVAIYNYAGGRGDVSLKLQADDWFSLVANDPEKMVEVNSGQVGQSQFTLEAKRIGKFKLTLSARMKGSANRADIVVREIEVIPNGRELSQVYNGRLESAVTQDVNFPVGAIPDSSKIFVRLYPGPMSQVIEGMDSLLRMPYGCFEQTSSSTYPNVLALDYMKRTKKLTPEVHAKAEGYISTGYQRLLTFEVPGGGFSWFGQAPANKILTAYGLMEFSEMSKVSDVDAKLISRTQQWLAGQQQKDGSWKPDTEFINEGATTRYNSDVLRITAYLAWSLENTGYHGPEVERARQYIEGHMNAKLDAYTLAVLANFAVESGDGGKDREFTRRAMELLLEARTEKDEQAWWNSDETGFYATGTSASVETTGLAVQALLKWGQSSGTVRKALTYIASKKDSSGTWGTTQATIMALRALLLATEKGSADTQGVVEVLLNGKPAGKVALTAENNDLLRQFVFKGGEIIAPKSYEEDGQSSAGKEKTAASSNTVELRFEGKGGLAYQIVGSTFLPWDHKVEKEALSIDVTYDRTHLAQDDIATATATATNNMNKSANMVMVDLGIPPGFDLLSEDLQAYQEKSAESKSGRLTKFSMTATQAILYFDSFAPHETVKLKFRLQAKYPIRARTFKSRVYEYYDPEVSATAPPVQLEVSKR